MQKKYLALTSRQATTDYYKVCNIFVCNDPHKIKQKNDIAN